jgi:hypothetical protein
MKLELLGKVGFESEFVRIRNRITWRKHELIDSSVFPLGKNCQGVII